MGDYAAEIAAEEREREHRSEVDALRAENERLRGENERLQLLLGARSTEAADIWMDEVARLEGELQAATRLLRNEHLGDGPPVPMSKSCEFCAFLASHPSPEAQQ